MTFAQRRNRLMTHFLECIPVVKRSTTVLHRTRSVSRHSDGLFSQYLRYTTFYMRPDTSVITHFDMCYKYTCSKAVWELRYAFPRVTVLFRLRDAEILSPASHLSVEACHKKKFPTYWRSPCLWCAGSVADWWWRVNSFPHHLFVYAA